MALFMDFHEDLKLPAGVIAQIAVPCGEVHHVHSLT
jgi:hypothetical protein